MGDGAVGGCCGLEAQQVVTLKNGKMWEEARFGGTYCVEVGLPARGDFLRGGNHCAPAAKTSRFSKNSIFLMAVVAFGMIENNNRVQIRKKSSFYAKIRAPQGEVNRKL